MRDDCFETSEGKHNYKLCMFTEIKQDGYINLGNKFNWGIEEEEDEDESNNNNNNNIINNKYNVIRYTGGTSCPPQRATTVTMKCGLEKKVCYVICYKPLYYILKFFFTSLSQIKGHMEKLICL